MRKIHRSLILWTLLSLLCVTMTGAGTGGRVLNRDDLSLVNPLDGSFGSALNSTTLTAAINAIGSDRKILMITPGTWTISTNLTIPENVGIRVASGAMFSANSSRTLAIKGAIEAPLQQIFTGAGTITVGTRILVLRAEWWGTKCDSVTHE
jgi:hypothetical protein